MPRIARDKAGWGQIVALMVALTAVWLGAPPASAQSPTFDHALWRGCAADPQRPSKGTCEGPRGQTVVTCVRMEHLGPDGRCDSDRPCSWNEQARPDHTCGYDPMVSVCLDWVANQCTRSAPPRQTCPPNEQTLYNPLRCVHAALRDAPRNPSGCLYDEVVVQDGKCGHNTVGGCQQGERVIAEPYHQEVIYCVPPTTDPECDITYLISLKRSCYYRPRPGSYTAGYFPYEARRCGDDPRANLELQYLCR